MTRFFPSLAAFAAFMPRVIVAEKFADVAGREAVAITLARRVRERIGTPEKLPPPLAESTQVRRVKMGYTADRTLYASGVLHKSIGWEHVSLRRTVVASSDEKAVWHELGPSNNHFPRRSFLASTVAAEEAELFEIFVKTFGLYFRPR